MKKILILSLVVLILSAVLPLLVLEDRSTDKSNPEKNAQIESTAAAVATQAKEISATLDESSEKVKKLVVSAGIEYLSENSSKETKLAVIEICKNNYIFNETHSIPQKTDISNFSDSLYSELLNLYDEAKLTFSQGGEIRYIPLIHRGHLHSATDDEHPYLRAVATPWEAYNKDFEYKKQAKCGLSVYSLEYLISEGYSRQEALSYLLPNFTIE